MAQRRHVERAAAVRGRFNRVDEAQSGAGGAAEVHQKTAGQDAATRHIRLKAAQVAAGVSRGAILATWKTMDDVVAIEEIQPVVIPGAALGERSGHRDTRGPLAEPQTAFGGNAGDEVSTAEAEPVVAHAGFKLQHAGGTAAVIGGETAGGDFHRLNGLDVDAGFKAAGDRIGNIEAVENVAGLAGLAAVEMSTALIVLHYAVHQGQRVPVILRGRVGDSLNLSVVELFALGGLRRIDRRG